MQRSLVLGGFALLAGVSMGLAWWGIAPVEASDAAATEAGSAGAPQEPSPGPALQLEDPDAVSLETPGRLSARPDPLARAPVGPRLVDASASASGVDLHGSILVVGGERRNLPALTLVFGRGAVTEKALSLDGNYLLPHLAAGHWRVAARVVGYKPLAAEIDVPSDPRQQEFDFTLERLPQLFVSMVTPAGQPLMKALRSEKGPVARMAVVAIATVDPPREHLGATLEDSYESYGVGTWRPSAGRENAEEVDEPRAGVLELSRPMSVFVSVCVAHTVLRTQFVPAGQEKVEFIISPDDLRAARGSLRFRIVDAESGVPITDGRVGLHQNGRFGTGQEIIQSDGSVEFPDETPGPRDLSIVCRGYEWVVEQVWIEPGRETDLGLYRLNRPVSIEGTAVDENGAPVRAWISVWPVERYDAAQRIADKFCWHADEDGRFNIHPAGKRRYFLRANDEKWASETVVVDASRGPVKDVRLRVAPGAPLSVSFDPATPRGARLCVRDMRGQPIAERAVDPESQAKISLAPGRYRVLAEFDGALHGERTVDVLGQPLGILLGP
jgi:hypothetical protein